MVKEYKDGMEGEETEGKVKGRVKAPLLLWILDTPLHNALDNTQSSQLQAALLLDKRLTPLTFTSGLEK